MIQLDNAPDGSIPLNNSRWKGWFTKLQAMVNGCFGPGQVWQNMTSSRAVGQAYTNNTLRPIMAEVTVVESGYTYFVVTKKVNGNEVSHDTIATIIGGTYYHAATLVVPPGATYEITVSQAALYEWWELS
jgi:hypothetical protein